MPHALKFPRMRRAVIPHVRAGIADVDELVALSLGHAAGRGRRLAGLGAGLFPGFAAVVGTLNNLPKPTARLRGVDAIGIGGRALHVINLPAGKVRAGDVPSLPLCVRGEDKCTLARADENSYPAHKLLL